MSLVGIGLVLRPSRLALTHCGCITPLENWLPSITNRACFLFGIHINFRETFCWERSRLLHFSRWAYFSYFCRKLTHGQLRWHLSPFWEHFLCIFFSSRLFPTKRHVFSEPSRSDFRECLYAGGKKCLWQAIQ